MKVFQFSHLYLRKPNNLFILFLSLGFVSSLYLNFHLSKNMENQEKRNKFKFKQIKDFQSTSLKNIDFELSVIKEVSEELES